jgi:hypothetical protein
MTAPILSATVSGVPTSSIDELVPPSATSWRSVLPLPYCWNLSSEPLAVGGQFAGKRLVQLVLREIDIGERYALSLTQLRSSIGLALELVMAITNSPRRSNSPSYR